MRAAAGESWAKRATPRYRAFVRYIVLGDYAYETVVGAAAPVGIRAIRKLRILAKVT
jgi:hypothetical protein